MDHSRSDYKDVEKMDLERKVYSLIKYRDCIELRQRIESLEKRSSVWQAYVETVDSLGEIWRSFGRQTRGIPDVDYSLAHAIFFRDLPLITKRVILVKMESLMEIKPFMKSDEALAFFKELM